MNPGADKNRLGEAAYRAYKAGIPPTIPRVRNLPYMDDANPNVERNDQLMYAILTKSASQLMKDASPDADMQMVVDNLKVKVYGEHLLIIQPSILTPTPPPMRQSKQAITTMQQMDQQIQDCQAAIELQSKKETLKQLQAQLAGDKEETLKQLQAQLAGGAQSNAGNTSQANPAQPHMGDGLALLTSAVHVKHAPDNVG